MSREFQIGKFDGLSGRAFTPLLFMLSSAWFYLMCCSATSLPPLVTSGLSIPPTPASPICTSPADSDAVYSPFSDHLDGDVPAHIDSVPAGSCEYISHHVADYPGDSPHLYVTPDMENGDSGPPGDGINVFLHDSLQFKRNLSFPAISKQLTPNLTLDTPLSPAEAISTSFTTYDLDARSYSGQFLIGHTLNPHFVRLYQLQDELGAGSYGFVMTACHRDEHHEVAVKFITKANVPDFAWMEDETVGRLPTEVFLLCSIDHENIVKCMDLFEDDLYFYLVQELHGSPWSTTPPTPSLLASVSEDSLANGDVITPIHSPDMQGPCRSRKSAVEAQGNTSTPSFQVNNVPMRPHVQRRPSYDLFECIEQSELKRLTVEQARYAFAQVVEAVHYLDCRGITHRDIKDENLVIDKKFKVKLIDFGSAVIVDPSQSRPFYKRFYGTTAYAAPEILLEKKYQAPPAEVWTLGVLLSYLLTGTHPFPTIDDAVRGNFVLTTSSELPEGAMNLMRRCLDPNPQTRATIREIKDHTWLIPSNRVD